MLQLNSSVRFLSHVEAQRNVINTVTHLLSVIKNISVGSIMMFCTTEQWPPPAASTFYISSGDGCGTIIVHNHRGFSVLREQSADVATTNHSGKFHVNRNPQFLSNTFRLDVVQRLSVTC